MNILDWGIDPPLLTQIDEPLDVATDNVRNALWYLA